MLRVKDLESMLKEIYPHTFTVSKINNHDYICIVFDDEHGDRNSSILLGMNDHTLDQVKRHVIERLKISKDDALKKIIEQYDPVFKKLSDS